MNTSSFANDLAEAQQVELSLKLKLETKGYTVSSTQDLGKFSGYDLVAQKQSDTPKFYIEVKDDKMSTFTGNVCIELYKTVKGQIEPSGLTATTSNTYVYHLEGAFYSIQVKKLRRFIDSYKDIKIVTGGDGGRCTLALIKKSDFINACICL